MFKIKVIRETTPYSYKYLTYYKIVLYSQKRLPNGRYGSGRSHVLGSLTLYKKTADICLYIYNPVSIIVLKMITNKVEELFKEYNLKEITN